MDKYEYNRAVVQEGLRKRAAARREAALEAAQEAESREMRSVINKNAQRKRQDDKRQHDINAARAAEAAVEKKKRQRQIQRQLRKLDKADYNSLVRTWCYLAAAATASLLFSANAVGPGFAIATCITASVASAIEFYFAWQRTKVRDNLREES